MAEPPPNLANNPIKSYKFKDYPQQAKGIISLSACLLSTFIYISIFYIFNLSPSTLFNNTKFWFFISNTLILIIATDYGAFSSSKQKQDLYEEYMKRSQARSPSPFVSQYSENNIVHQKSIPQQEVENSEEIIKQVVVQKSEIPENKLEIVIKSDLEKPSSENFHEMEPEFAPKAHIEAYNYKKKIEARSCHCSVSDKAIRAVNDESKIFIHQSEGEKSEPNVEENEFSTMSDEELNRRVEEFIQKFNREIRLQRTRNFT